MWSGWTLTVKSLNELAELTSSKRIFESDYVSCGIPFFRGKEISRLVEGKSIDDPCFISEVRFNSIKVRFGAPIRGEILVTAVGTLGNVYVVDTDEHFYFKDGNLIWLREIHNVSPQFLGIQLRRSKAAILEGAIGTSQKALTIVVLGRLLIAIPPALEQHAIAEALSDADALIESLEQLLTKKRHLKQAAMQELLTGKKRLPGFSGEWEETRLGDAIEKFVGGGTPSRTNSRYWGDEIPWVTVKDFATFNPLYSQETITKAGLHNSASHLIPKGTLITSTRMALGKAVIYEVDVAINQDLKALFPRTVLDTQYLYFWFEYHGKAIDELGSGSTVKGISLPDLKKIQIHLPPNVEQAAIVTILSEMDAEISDLEELLAKTHALKQGMMQKLLTGEVRLI